MVHGGLVMANTHTYCWIEIGTTDSQLSMDIHYPHHSVLILAQIAPLQRLTLAISGASILSPTFFFVGRLN